MAPYTEPYDTADYLTDAETISAYLEEAWESGDPRIVVKSLATVARARGGLVQLSKETGLALDALQTALDEKGVPDLVTLMKVLQAFQLKITLTPTAETPIAA